MMEALERSIWDKHSVMCIQESVTRGPCWNLEATYHVVWGAEAKIMYGKEIGKNVRRSHFNYVYHNDRIYLKANIDTDVIAQMFY